MSGMIGSLGMRTRLNDLRDTRMNTSPVYETVADFQADGGVSHYFPDAYGKDSCNLNNKTGTGGSINENRIAGPFGGAAADCGHAFGTHANTVAGWQFTNFYKSGTTAFGTSDRTLALWVSRIGNNNSEPTLFQIGNHSGANSIWACGFGNNNHTMRVVCIGSDVNFSSDALIDNTGKWQHLVWTLTGTTAKAYINGVFKNTQTHGAQPNTNSGASKIGYGEWNSSNSNKYCSAALDQIAVWSRCLSDHEIKRMYDNHRMKILDISAY